MKTVLVASGTSQNKLKFATSFIDTYLNERGIAVKVVGESIYEVKLKEVEPTVIVVIGPHSFGEEYPVVNGMAFITKMGMEQCCDDILHHLS
ncbi:hypothetical protein I6N95_07680 [Vagococcus sp. BWB3-3]|uniref:Uncharacterized protein n=1 Tax=Vagococcus allomyrinae TaxID=2794353 RepID=A0A940P3P5_9ENTE|nr:hypothetical protein [Vagococcus allomyrinae]MBP1040882.1 hypothetical protein [Vagococcus allomyrinae]